LLAAGGARHGRIVTLLKGENRSIPLDRNQPSCVRKPSTYVGEAQHLIRFRKPPVRLVHLRQHASLLHPLYTKQNSVQQRHSDHNPFRGLPARCALSECRLHFQAWWTWTLGQGRPLQSPKLPQNIAGNGCSSAYRRLQSQRADRVDEMGHEASRKSYPGRNRERMFSKSAFDFGSIWPLVENPRSKSAVGVVHFVRSDRTSSFHHKAKSTLKSVAQVERAAVTSVIARKIVIKGAEEGLEA
jgi:hypothetical protein